MIFFFFFNLKINVLVLIRKKLKNEEGERKYHIIRKNACIACVFDEKYGSFFDVKIR